MHFHCLVHLYTTWMNGRCDEYSTKEKNMYYSLRLHLPVRYLVFFDDLWCFCWCRVANATSDILFSCLGAFSYRLIVLNWIYRIEYSSILFVCWIATVSYGCEYTLLNDSTKENLEQCQQQQQQWKNTRTNNVSIFSFMICECVGNTMFYRYIKFDFSIFYCIFSLLNHHTLTKL